METFPEKRRMFVAGELVELWENPDFAFPTSENDLEECVESERWVLVFNAMMLGANVASEAQAC